MLKLIAVASLFVQNRGQKLRDSGICEEQIPRSFWTGLRQQNSFKKGKEPFLLLRFLWASKENEENIKKIN